MQLKKNHSVMSVVALSVCLLTLLLSGCNNDVFVPRPPHADFGSHTLKVGETLEIQLPYDPYDVDMENLYLEVSAGENEIIYTGYLWNFKSQLIGIRYSLNKDNGKVKVTADYNYFPEPITFSLSSIGWDSNKIGITVPLESTEKYAPGKIEYCLTQWSSENSVVQFMGGIRENNTSETVTDELTPVVLAQTFARFISQDVGAFQLFGDNTPLLPAVAMDSRGFPVEIDEKIPYQNDYSKLPGYELPAGEPYRFTIAPWQKVSTLISVERTFYTLDYTLEATRSDGTTLVLPGNYIIISPKRYIYEVKPQ